MSDTAGTSPLVGCVLLSKCDACTYGLGDYCYDPPQWHSWAEIDDVEHAAATGQPDPRSSRCGCPCAAAPAGESQ